MDELQQWLENDKASGRRAQRFAAQAKYLREHVVAGSRDASGNSIGTLVASLERAAASRTHPATEEHYAECERCEFVIEMGGAEAL